MDKLTYIAIILYAACLILFFNINPDGKLLESLIKDERTVFSTILISSVTILAITFTISQFIMSKISESYSPLIVGHFLRSNINKITFYSFLAITIAAASSLTLLNSSIPHEFHHTLILMCIFGFIGTLVLFTRNYFIMMEILDPLKFSSILSNEIIGRIKKRDNVFEDFITASGNIALNFADKNETRITNHYLIQLQEVATSFLDQKEQSDKTNLDHNEPFYYNINNNIISLVLIQLERIYKKVYLKNDTEIANKVIEVSETILVHALEKPENQDIVRLFTHRSYGNYLNELQHITSRDLSPRREKYRFASSLLGMPVKFLVSDKVDIQYLREFAPDHMFYIAKTMIDNDDYQSFKQFVRASSDNIFFNMDPGQISSQIRNKFLGNYSNEEFNRLLYELEFSIRIECALSDYNIMDFVNKLDQYKQTIIRLNSGISLIKLDEEIFEIKRSALKYYVNSLIYQAFFWIGSYLIYKGKEYEIYLLTLLNLGKTEKSNVTYLNHPPIPQDLTWILLSLLGKTGGTSMLEFDDYQDSQPFFFKYFGIILLQSDNEFEFPSQNELLQFVDHDDFDILSRWSSICGRLRTDQFLTYTENLQDYVDLTKFTTYQNPIQIIKDKVTRLQKQALECENMLIAIRPLDKTIIQETMSKIQIEYDKESIIDQISNVSITTEKSPSLIPIIRNYDIPKTFFQEISGVSTYRDGVYTDIAIQFSSLEVSYLVKTLQNTNRIKTTVIDIQNLKESLETIHVQMLEAGYEPDIVFIPFYLVSEYYSQKQPHPYEREININGKYLKTVFSKQLKDNEIFFTQKRNIKSIFRQLNGKRLFVDVNQHKTNKILATIECSFSCNHEIIDPKFIRKINVKNVEKSKFYQNKMKTNAVKK